MVSEETRARPTQPQKNARLRIPRGPPSGSPAVSDRSRRLRGHGGDRGRLLIRPFATGTGGFLAIGALALMGIAVSNVLMPVIVKRYFPDRVGSMTGLYSMALAFGTAFAAATVPMTQALGGGWRLGLGVWAIFATLAVLPWIGPARDRGAAVTSTAADGGCRSR